MTRGKIIYINNDSQVYVTCEFNGDMHPHRYGEDDFCNATDENSYDIDIQTPNLLYDFISNNGVICQNEV